MLTDVTYDCFEKQYYLCTTNIYVAELDRYSIAFQAVLGGLTSEHYTAYFLALFKAYSTQFEKFNQDSDWIGLIVDFSQAQRNGFLNAYRKFTGKDNGEKYVKGCYYHYQQSVQRLLTNKGVVHQDKEDMFRELTSIMYTTSGRNTFDGAVADLRANFPNAKKWIDWWLRPEIAGMIFKSQGVLHTDLQNTETRTTNGVEAFHRNLYRVVQSKKPLVATLGQIFQYLINEETNLERASICLPVDYTRKKQPYKKRVPKKFVNDGRAPDTTNALIPKKRSRESAVGRLVELPDEKTHTTRLVNKRHRKDEEEEKKEEEKEKEKKRIEMISSRAQRAARLSELKVQHKRQKKIEAEIRAKQRTTVQAAVEESSTTYIQDDKALHKGSEQLIVESGVHELLHIPTRRSIPSRINIEALAEVALDEESAIEKFGNVEKTEGYPLKIKRNEFNSCYIDSVFELLMRVVLPVFELPVELSANVLSKDHLMYTLDNLASSWDFVKGIEVAREHVWNHATSYGFQKGEFNDPVLKHFAFATQRVVNKISLPKGPGSTWDAEEIVPAEVPEAVYRHPLIYLTEDLISENELDCPRTANADWSTALTVFLTEPVIEAHERYSGLLGQQNIVNYPNALFLIDPSISSSIRRSKQESDTSFQIFYPKTITVQQRVYRIAGRLVSSKAAGQHFWCLCSIDGQVMKVDNMMPEAGCVKQNLHGKTRNTVLVVYRLLDEEEQWNLTLDKWYNRKDRHTILKRHAKRVELLLNN